MSYQVRNAERAKAHFADTPRWRIYRDTERGPVHSDWHKVPGRFQTVDVLRAFCEVNSQQVDWADQYGEPGYETPAKGILFADWNDISKPLQTRLEKQGYELEWSDEWYVDSSSSPAKAYRTQPDGHGWESRLRMIDGNYLTPDSDAQEWIDAALNDGITGEPLPSWFDSSELSLRGFVMMPDSTNSDTVPAEAVKEGYEVILRRGSSQVFYEVWTRREAKREILFDEASGVYIPRRFAREIDRERCTFDTKFGDNGPEQLSDWAILEAGPDHEHYWEVWDDVLRDCELTMDDGTKVRLEQDGSVFYVEVGAELCEYEDKYYVHK